MNGSASSPRLKRAFFVFRSVALEVNLAPMSLDVPSAGADRSAPVFDFASILDRRELSAIEFDFGLL